MKEWISKPYLSNRLGFGLPFPIRIVQVRIQVRMVIETVYTRRTIADTSGN